MSDGYGDYRESHVTPKQVEWYEHGVLRPGSYENWQWELEQGYLTEILDRYLSARPIRLLDFACGTGRIISFLEPRVAEATGIDISAEMLGLARPKVQRATLIRGDATRDPSLLRGPYDLITAFRFFLNAQEDLRTDAWRALRDVLDQDGLLVFNMTGNALSLRGIMGFVRKYLLRRRINQLSYLGVKRRLRRQGLRIVEFRGLSLLTPKLHRRLSPQVRDALERLLARARFLQFFAVDLVFVVAHADRRRGSR